MPMTSYYANVMSDVFVDGLETLPLDYYHTDLNHTEHRREDSILQIRRGSDVKLFQLGKFHPITCPVKD